MEYAIETNNLVKHYGAAKVLNNLSMHVPTSKVYGFLGKNGSGKTTTIRIIMGLVKADKGTVKVFGIDMAKDRINAVKNMGAIVEVPGVYENLTAAENLEITVNMFKTDKKRIYEVLDLVGLSGTGYKKAGAFSLGMKQRLGIANSLIHSPKMLILDEPTNGLDPAGIKEMRKLIRNLSNDLGITVLISSHLLNEIEQMADYVGVIDSGRLLVEATTSSLCAEQNYLLLETDDVNKTTEIIRSMNFANETDNTFVKVLCKKEDNGNINRHLVNNGIFVYSMESVSKTLEDMFLSLTSQDSNKGGLI